MFPSLPTCVQEGGRKKIRTHPQRIPSRMDTFRSSLGVYPVGVNAELGNQPIQQIEHLLQVLIGPLIIPGAAGWKHHDRRIGCLVRRDTAVAGKKAD